MGYYEDRRALFTVAPPFLVARTPPRAAKIVHYNKSHEVKYLRRFHASDQRALFGFSFVSINRGRVGCLSLQPFGTFRAPFAVV